MCNISGNVGDCFPNSIVGIDTPIDSTLSVENLKETIPAADVLLNNSEFGFKSRLKTFLFNRNYKQLSTNYTSAFNPYLMQLKNGKSTS